MSHIERIRVSEALGESIAREATRNGTTMQAVLDGALRTLLDEEESTRLALTPKRANLAVHSEGRIVIAIYNGRFAGVGVDVFPGKADESTFRPRQLRYGRFCPGGKLLLDWCDWFRDMCRGAGVKI